MKITRGGLAVVQILISLAVVGCTSNQPYHTKLKLSSSVPPDPTAVVQSHVEADGNYKIGFVEFDDQGWFYNYDQLDFVEKMIRVEAGLPLVPGATSSPTTNRAISPRGIILVTFVHGWKQNASSTGQGVAQFRDILLYLSRGEAARARNDPEHHPARRIVGVYAAWRGLSASCEPFKELSFWERKNTAHKVGDNGGLTRLLVDLEQIQKDSEGLRLGSEARSELIIIGHSFGAAAVYWALAPIITERFALAIHNNEPLKPLGDQVILLNPAFEAQRYYDMYQMATAIRRHPRPDQRPVLSIFTSKGDWATHYAFPFGRSVGTLFDDNRSCEQSAANIDAVGWHKPFLTHELNFRPNASPAKLDPPIHVATMSQQNVPDVTQLQQSLNNIQSLRGKSNPGERVPFEQCTLEPIKGFRADDPFLVVAVDSKIMSGHTDITNPVLNHFIWEYIEFCQPDVHAPPK